MSILLLILVALHGGRVSVNETHVDLIELNHFYSDDGELKYTQIIAYEWSPDYRRHHVQSWYLADKMCHTPHVRGGMWHAPGMRSEAFRETWTFYDPERKNKELFDERNRLRVPIRKALHGVH